MLKSKTHFPQVPVEVAKKVAKAEFNRHASDAVGAPKKKRISNGHALADPVPVPDEDESI